MNSGTPLSFNEIDFCIARAAVGAGTPFGIGEDFAKACVWLACLGYDPAPIAASALSGFAESKSCGGLELQHLRGGVLIASSGPRTLSALFAGPVVADQLAVASGSKSEFRLELAETDHPLLVLAAVGARGLGKHRASAFWRMPSGAQVHAALHRDAAAIAGLENSGTASTGPAKVEIVLNGTPGASQHAPRAQPALLADGRTRAAEFGVAADNAAWRKVQRYFRKCLMPSTLQSREHGAGAGDIDNA